MTAFKAVSFPVIMPRQAIWALLAVLYLVIRFIFTVQLDSFGPYSSYIFETIDVGLAFALAGRTVIGYWRVSRLVLVAATGSLVMGFAIFRSAGLAGIAIPFDLNGGETLVFLLLVAPVLEELIFRFFLWQPIEALAKNSFVAWLATSLIFSYAHLHAIWNVPSSIHPFIAYQTVYTLFLGLGCGYFVFRGRSLAGAIAVHFAFNLGFYLASLV